MKFGTQLLRDSNVSLRATRYPDMAADGSQDSGFVRSWPATIILGVITVGVIIFAASEWGEAKRTDQTNPDSNPTEFLVANGRADIGVDRVIAQSGDASAFIKATDAATISMLPAAWKRAPEQSSRGLLQAVKADQYRGKRIRLSGALKTKDVKPGTGLWMRIDGKTRMLAIDAMQDRMVTGTTDWKSHSVVLDVPQDAIGISFGVLGKSIAEGQVWVDDMTLDVVETDVAVTGVSDLKDKVEDYSKSEQQQLAERYADAGHAPRNLEFEDGSEFYMVGLDATQSHSGDAAASIELIIAKEKPANSPTVPKGWTRPPAHNVLMQFIKADEYRGKRVRLSGYVKTNKSDGWAGLWMRIDGKENRLTFDNQSDRPIIGITDWTLYEVVLDVADDAVGIAYGLVSAGEGKAWIDDIALEVVDAAVKSTGLDIEPPKTTREDYARIISGYQAAPGKPSNLNFESE